MINTRIPASTLARAAFALLVTGFAVFLPSSGCAPATVCFRNTDCAVGFSCVKGTCVMFTSSTTTDDAGVASGAGTDPGTAGGALTNDTGTAGTTSVDAGGGDSTSSAGSDTGTAGNAGTAATAGSGGV
jgi:hypothetical protein